MNVLSQSLVAFLASVRGKKFMLSGPVGLPAGATDTFAYVNALNIN
jgi:hypothetical protein